MFIKYAQKLLLLLLAAWIFVSISRTFYNLSKLYTQEKAWIQASDEERKIKAYGNIYNLSKTINKTVSEDKCISLYSKDTGITYYLLRYLIFPRKIYWTNLKDISNISTEALRKGGEVCNYILIENIKNIDLEEEKMLIRAKNIEIIGNSAIIKNE